jgi:type I restriction enzyme S subunit
MKNNLPKLRFPEFSGEWSLAIVGDLCNSIVPGRNKPVLFDGNIPWITIPDITSSKISNSINNLYVSENEANQQGCKILPSGAVIMSCVGEFGIVGISADRIIINQQLHSFVCNDELINYFLMYSLITKIYFMEQIATKSSVSYMNKESCNSIPIYYPSIEEQSKIADFLTSIDDKIQQLTQKEELLEQYKKGVTQQIFSQKIRFKDDNGNDYPDWEEKNLGDISKQYYQGINTTADALKYNDSGYPILQAKHITDEVISYDDVKFVNQIDYDRYREKYKPKLNDILISNIGTIGKIVLIENDMEFLIAWNIFKVTLSEKNLSPRFITFALKKKSSEGYFESIKTGNATKFVNKEDMLSTNIPIPNFEEQTKISDLLTSIDDKITQVNTQLEKTKLFKKALLQQLFI